MKNNKFYILHFTFYIIFIPLCIILINSCTTEPQTGSLTGTVNLEGESDHSGITVGIYEQVVLDTTITRINNQYPHIGIKISQHTEFDHRFGTLVKTGETEASGYFEIKDIPTGIYNVVAIKDGFGFRYIYEISISDGDNSLSNLMKQSPLNDWYEKNEGNFEMNSEECKMNNESLSSPHYSLYIIHSTLDSNNKECKTDLILFPETIINADITEATTFESFHHYIIEQDIIVDNELTIEPGAVVRLNQGKDITNYGIFNAVGDYEKFIWFTKNDGFSENLNTVEPDSNYIWDRITHEPYSQAEVQWCKFDWANIGMLNHLNGFEITDCIFRKSQCGFKAEDVDFTFCSNLLCEDITNESEGGIYCIQISNGIIEKNVINNCDHGMKIKDESNPEVKNNYIIDCENGINVSYSSFPTIHNNEIEKCEISINVPRYSEPYIEKNIINGNIGFQGNEHIIISTINIHYNNMNCFHYAIVLGHSHIVNAENNYFYTTDETEIKNLFFGEEINYIPFLYEENENAGIKK